MRIVTWNLDHGHGSVVWPRLQTSLGADLVLLQESRQPVLHDGVAWEPVPHNDWGSAVFSANGAVRATPIAGYEGWVVGGELVDSSLNTPGRSLFVFSVHSPRRPYVEEVVSILDLIEKDVPSQADLILGGDFNFLSLGNRRKGEDIQTTPAEQAALARFAKRGLVSCWTAAHPGHALGQTLRWSADKAPDKSTPFHCDGIFVPEAWRPGIVCEILTSATFEVSDHYPVAAWVSR
jgi:hypothetical protein